MILIRLQELKKEVLPISTFSRVFYLQFQQKSWSLLNFLVHIVYYVLIFYLEMLVCLDYEKASICLDSTTFYNSWLVEEWVHVVVLRQVDQSLTGDIFMYDVLTQLRCVLHMKIVYKKVSI